MLLRENSLIAIREVIRDNILRNHFLIYDALINCDDLLEESFI